MCSARYQWPKQIFCFAHRICSNQPTNRTPRGTHFASSVIPFFLVWLKTWDPWKPGFVCPRGVGGIGRFKTQRHKVGGIGVYAYIYIYAYDIWYIRYIHVWKYIHMHMQILCFICISLSLSFFNICIYIYICMCIMLYTLQIFLMSVAESWVWIIRNFWNVYFLMYIIYEYISWVNYDIFVHIWEAPLGF